MLFRSTYAIYGLAGSSVAAGSMNNNVIDTLYNTGVPGTLTSLIYGLYYSTTSVAGSTVNNNVIRNITIQGTSTGNQSIYASYLSPSGASNTFKGNRIARIGTTTSTTGISTDAQLGGSMNGYVIGAQLAGSTTVGPKYFEGNTFNSLIAGGSNGIARGVWATTGIDWYIYNNAFSRINAPFNSPTTAPAASSSTTATTGLAAYGIDIANATAGYNYYVYNNSVYLTGSGGGVNYATSGIHANVTPNVTLVNNLVINLTNPGASQAAVAYRRSGALSATYMAASDNNLFYAGTPGATKLIYGEGIGATTNAKQTLADYKTYVGPTRDANSRTETTTPFVAAATDSLLHIAATTATFVESGGKPYQSLATDIDGATRSTTAPDIGADEGNFVGILPTIASITASPATGQCTPVNHTITVVASASVTSVNLNYSLNGVAQTAIPMSNGGSGTTWTAVIPAALPGVVVTFNAVASDGTYTANATGTSYQDAYLAAYALTNTVNPTAVCLGGSVALNAYLGAASAAPSSYPSISFSTTADEELFGFTLGTINNTSNCSTVAPGPGSVNSSYSNYTTSIQPTLVVAGNTYSGTVTAGYCGTTAFSNIVSIYIDYNRNGVFTDAGENVWNSAYGAKTFSSQVLPFSFTVPSNLSTFGNTRLRVVINESTTAPSTGAFSYGEAEDYMVQLAGGAGFTYTWSNGTSNVFSGTGNFTPSTAGSYSLTATATDPNG